MSNSDKLWEQAAEALSPTDRGNLSFEATGDLDIIKQVLNATITRRDDVLKKRWTFTKKDGKVIILRDLTDKIIGYVQKFQAAADFLVGLDASGHAALPWAGIKFFISVCAARIPGI
jgi:hypothetical protein